jgi:HSP20 family protein
MTLTTYRNSYPTLWDNFFDDFFYKTENHDLSPRARVLEKDDRISVVFEIPGVKKEDIKVSVEDGVLNVSALKKAEKKEKAREIYLNEMSFGEYNGPFGSATTLSPTASKPLMKTVF